MIQIHIRGKKVNRMTDVESQRRKAICEIAGVDDIGDLSDGFHTFNSLYEQRMILFAALVKAYKDKAWKSYRHEDGEYCFGGGWFIVGIDTSEGSYTYHYENKYFDLFDCEELACAKHWDGHTEKDVTRLLSMPSVQPEPCEDAVSRKAVEEMLQSGFPARGMWEIEGDVVKQSVCETLTDALMNLEKLPSVTPKQRWIPIKVRPMDDEERKEWSERIGYDIEYEYAVMFDCPMPDDGQEVWVCSKCGNVWQDTCLIDEGIYLEENGDWDGIVAWMPFDKPEPYQEEGSE